jgi:pyruvate/2-oxoglutarate dehydrogenase complex dihydrolipoamide dehydrogenase (E3) component
MPRSRKKIPRDLEKIEMPFYLLKEDSARVPGFMKALVAGSDDRILGFTMIGSEAGEIMAAVQTAMLGNLPYWKLRDAVLAHPTMAEGLGSLFANMLPRPGE